MSPRPQPIRTGTVRRALSLAVTLATLLAAQTGTAEDFRWLNLKRTRIAVPAGCETVDKTGTLHRCMQKDASGAFFVSLDEYVLLKAVPGATPEPAAAVQLIMTEGFDDFADQSVADTDWHRISSAPVPAADLPGGMAACRAYTFNSGASEFKLRERGLYCAAPARRGKDFMVMIAAVTALVPSGGAAIPASFDARARGLLATYGMR